MKKPESFVVYHSTLFAHARKIYKEPVNNESSFPKMANMNIMPDYWIEAELFVVDWEVRDMEKQEQEKSYTDDAENDIRSFIADW